MYHRRVRTALALTTAIGSLPLLAASAAAQSLPSGFSPEAPHTATYTTGPTTGEVNLGTTQRTLINWNDFNVGAGRTVTFTYGGASNGAVLNRVIGGGASTISGTITGPSNLDVFLFNPNGVVFGAGANVNVGSLVASTLGIADADFFDGSPYNLTGTATTGITVAPTATLTTTRAAAPLVLVGGSYSLGGSLTSAGDVAVVAGSNITMNIAPASPLSVTIDAGTPLSTPFTVGGTIAGRNVYLATATRAGVVGALLNVTGSITATSAIATDRGIVLAAGNSASGITVASGGGSDTSGDAGVTLAGGSTLTAARGVGAPVSSAHIEVRARDGVTGSGSLNAADAVSLSSGLGDLTLDAPGTVTAGTGLTGSAAGTVRLASATAQSGDVSLSGSALQLNSTLAATAGSISLTGPTTLTGNSTVTAGGAGSTITFNDTVDGAATLTTSSDAGTRFEQSVGANTRLTSLSVTGPTRLKGNGLSTTGNIALGAVALSAPANSVALSSSGNGAVTLGAVTGNNIALSVSNGTGQQSFNGISGTAGLTLTGTGTRTLNAGTYDVTTGDAAFSFGAVTVNGAVTFAQPTTLGATTLGSASSIASGAHDLTLGTVNGGFALTATTTGALTAGAIGGATAPTAVTMTGGTLVANGATSSGDINLTSSTGNLTLASGVLTAPNVILSTPAAFVNQAGAGAINASNRWLVYSANPAANSFGGLNSGNTAIWNGTRATRAPATLAGNRYVFAQQPTVTFTSTNTAKTYGDTPTLAGQFSVSGLQPAVANAYLADTNATAFSGAPSLSSTGTAANADVAGGPYVIDIAAGTLASDAGYAFAFSNAGRLSLSTKALTANVVANSKTYDGTTTASGGASLVGVVTGDNVSTTAGGYSFADKNAGTGKTVTVTGISLTGTDAGNYTLTVPASVLADILPKALTANIVANNKTYDGTTAANGSVALTGVVSGDSVAATAGTYAFANKTAGTGKTVTVTGVSLTGADMANYTLTLPAAVLADILPKALTATVTANSKTYDGTTAAAGSASLAGVIAGDTVAATGGSYIFADKNVGTAKTVSVAGVSLTGTDAGNYTLTVPASVLAAILPKPLTANIVANNKTYDGTTAATGSVSLTGVVSGDSISTTNGAYAFASRNAGTGKAVAVTGVSLTGADAGNYTLSVPASVLADILPKALTATVSANSKTYDGTSAATGSASLAGVVAGDTVATTAGTYAFANKNAGTGKTVAVTGVSLAGADAGNYTLTVPASVLADILPKALTANIVANDKTYDGTTAATGSVSLAGTVGGDQVSATGASFAFADKNAGAGKTVHVSGVTLSGADAANYRLTSPALAAASISPKAISGTAAASSKTYDGSAATTGAIVLSGTVAGDEVSTSGATFVFADRNAGTGKTVNVSGATLSGADAGNYVLTLPATTAADILRRALTIAANSAAKDEGAADPALTFTVRSGSLVAGDALAGNLARTAGETPGNYAIGQGTLSAGANYSISFEQGQFVIRSVATTPEMPNAVAQIVPLRALPLPSQIAAPAATSAPIEVDPAIFCTSPDGCQTR